VGIQVLFKVTTLKVEYQVLVEVEKLSTVKKALVYTIFGAG
jgi:hypothetical protein